jgi:glycosyltransferase involved in cell wall biosynthesis
VDVIRRYSDRLAWWVSERDSGQAEAINKGLSRARGEIVAWLNSDDLYLPGAFQRAVAALQADPKLGMVFGDALTIDPTGRPLNTLKFGPWGRDELFGFRIICQPAVFMRREVLEQAALSPGVYLAPDYHYMLDHHLWVRMARLAPVRYLPGLLAAARQHPGAKNVSQAPGFGRETLRLLAWMRTQPDLAAHIAAHRRQVEGGAFRLNARYLLDGGLYAAALGEYGRALWTRPGYALQHWHRMLYALLSLLGGSHLAALYMELRARGLVDRQRRPDPDSIASALPAEYSQQIANWPGLHLETTHS